MARSPHSAPWKMKQAAKRPSRRCGAMHPARLDRGPAPPEPALAAADPSFRCGGDRAADFLAAATGVTRFRRGLLVHALLARLPEIAPEQRRAIALHYAATPVAWTDAEALVRRNPGGAGRSRFRRRLRARQPGRSRSAGGTAGTGQRRARQWPHRPAGGDGNTSADPGFQDQPPAARHAKPRCRRSISPRWRFTAPARRKICSRTSESFAAWSLPTDPGFYSFRMWFWTPEWRLFPPALTRGQARS